MRSGRLRWRWLRSDRAPSPAYLWAEPYSELVVLVRHAPAFEPSRLALESLQEVLKEVTDKDAVRVMPPVALEGWMAERRSWTDEQLDKVVRSSKLGQARAYGLGEQALLEVYYLDGGGPRGAAGIMVDGRAIVFSELRTAPELERMTLMRPRVSWRSRSPRWIRSHPVSS